MAPRSKDDLVEGMTADIGETPSNEDTTAWLRREIHACLQDALMGTYDVADARIQEICILRAMAIDLCVHGDLADDLDDPAR
jgi:hypothetical protein